MMQRSSASSSEITPSRTESTTPRATAAWAGPNICPTCFSPLIVTLLAMIVSGLAGRLGATTASRFVWPSFWFRSAPANASPTGPSLDPINRSMWATSLPSPTRDSPTDRVLAMCLPLLLVLRGIQVARASWPRRGASLARRTRAAQSGPPCSRGYAAARGCLRGHDLNYGRARTASTAPSSTVISVVTTEHAATCAGCGCGCDDIEVAVAAGSARACDPHLRDRRRVVRRAGGRRGRSRPASTAARWTSPRRSRRRPRSSARPGFRSCAASARPTVRASARPWRWPRPSAP